MMLVLLYLLIQIYLYLKVFASYDPATSTNTSEINTNVLSGINDWASQTQINNFNSTFRLGSFEKAISLADSSITDVSTQLTLLRYIRPTTNQTNTYCIATGGALYDSNPSNNDGTTCKKEPILLSGTFRTSDRPGVDQQFEDDGFGNLRTFYNTGNRKVYTNNAAGTVNYSTGEVCFGPVAIIGAGVNIPVNGISITELQLVGLTKRSITCFQFLFYHSANVSKFLLQPLGTIINIVN